MQSCIARCLILVLPLAGCRNEVIATAPAPAPAPAAVPAPSTAPAASPAPAAGVPAPLVTTPLRPAPVPPPAAPAVTPAPPPPVAAKSAPRTTPPASPPPPSQAGWTAGRVSRPVPGPGNSLLATLRVGVHERYERVVFEFAGSRLPGYHIEYIDKPVRECGSGNVAPMAGDAWLEVRLEDAVAHTEAGRPTLTRRNWTRQGNIRQIRLTCDFEGVVTVVLGVGSPNRYRVITLTNPTRLVVDVRR